MTKDLIIRGVPRSLQIDTWWLATEADIPPPAPPAKPSWSAADGPGRPLLVLAGLVALADALFYGHELGLSLAIFAGSVFAVTVALRGDGRRIGPACLLAASVLPVVELVQPLSVLFLTTGLLISLTWAAVGSAALWRGAVALAASMPIRGLADLTRAMRALAEDTKRHRRLASLTSWAFPLGGGLVLMSLLAEANPVLAAVLSDLFAFRFVTGEAILRLMFWIGAGLVIWPLITMTPSAQTDRPLTLTLPGIGLGRASVEKAVLLFNAILAVQTAMDAFYLWGGAALPPGISAADYAHRGAYPLLATALLAGGFALAARPFTAENPRLRFLVLLWIGQNIALTLSALLRLDLYIDEYGLTYLRLHAAIWMVLVAAGLGLTGWQIWRRRSNLWLVLRATALGIGTLYAACFINFAALIATENLARANGIDGAYVCSLGPTAAAAIRAAGFDAVPIETEGYGIGECRVGRPHITGWRDWGFRNWRVNRYLDITPLAEGS